MTSPVLTEQFYTAAFLIREAAGYLSRDAGTMANATGAETAFQGGLVVSVSPTNAAASAAAAGNAGNGTVGAIAVGAAAQLGSYLLKFTKATDFELIDPQGDVAGVGSAGQAFQGGGLSFTVTAGGTAFAAGDSFQVTATGGTPAYVPYTGAAPAAAILFNHRVVPAGSTRKVTVIARLAEVNAAEVQWDASVLAAGNAAQLKANAIAQLAQASILFR